MILDSSALIAITRGEPESVICFRALLDAPIARLSAANLLEAAIVVDRWRDPEASREFDALIAGFAVVIEPVTANQVRIAREAYGRFGKGAGHPAKLNFGDCFAYALAKDFDEPLLFIGNDFVHTDVRSALPITVDPGSIGPVGDTLATAGTGRPRMPTPELDPLEAEELRRCTPEMRGWYYQIKNYILGLGDDVEARPRHRYVPFWRLGRPGPQAVFANANFRPSKNRLIIDIPKLEDDTPFDGEFLLPWMGRQKRDKVVHVVIDSDEDVERAKPFIQQSYANLD